MHSLITAVAAHDEAARFLAWPGDFDLGQGDHVENVHLMSGAALEGFAGAGAGGTYFFCGDGGEERPVLYADSEGSAALVAIGLPELLQLLLVAPWWRGCRAFTEEESCTLAAEYLEDMPDLTVRRDRAAEVLGLGLPTEAEALSRLHRVATETGKDSSWSSRTRTIPTIRSSRAEPGSPPRQVPPRIGPAPCQRGSVSGQPRG